MESDEPGGFVQIHMLDEATKAWLDQEDHWMIEMEKYVRSFTLLPSLLNEKRTTTYEESKLQFWMPFVKANLDLILKEWNFTKISRNLFENAVDAPMPVLHQC